MKAFSEQTKQYFDSSLLDKFVQGTDEYKLESEEEKRNELEKGAWNRLVAMGFLINSDKDKYGRLVRDLRKDFANEDDNFSENINNDERENELLI